MLSHQEYLGGTESEAHEVVEEEVVQLVGSHQVFRLLLYFSVFVGRCQLGRYGGVDDVGQRVFLSAEGGLCRQVADDILYQRLGDACIHAVHRHVVAVIGSPAQRQFRQVAGADNQRIQLVSQVHQYLCAFASLRVLVGGIVDVSVVTDVLEVLGHSLCDGYLHLRYAQRLHQRRCIVVGAVGSTESGHGHPNDSLAVQSHLVEGTDAHQQGQRRVQSAADTHHHMLAVGVQQSLGQSCGLNVQYLLAGGCHLVVSGYEWVRVNLSDKFEGMFAHDFLGVDNLGMGIALGIDECRVGMSLGAQAFHVYLGYLHLGLQREALALSQQQAVLENHGIAAIDHILSRLAEATRAVHITAHRAGTLLSQKRAQVGVLAYQLIAGRTVQDNVGTGHRQVVAGGNGSPYVLADFYSKLHTVAGIEELGFCRHADLTTCQIDGRGVQVLGRGEPALLVELVVVRQIGLGHHAQNGSALQHDGTVQQQAVNLYGHAYHADDVQLAGEVHQVYQALLGLRQEQLFLKQVLTAVARHTQLREAYHLYTLTLGQRYQSLYLLDVIVNVGNLYGRYCCCHFYQSVLHIL